MIGPKVHSVLLDPCSEVNVIPEALPKSMDTPIQPTDVKVRPTNGTDILAAGQVIVTAYIDSLPIQLNAIISSQLHEIILGLPFLHDNKVSRPYNEKFITCQHGSARQVVLGHVRFKGKAQNLCPAQLLNR